MDAQLKRGLLDVCVLAAIKNEDSYGYKIMLEAAGMLTVRSAEHDGRLRKYYHITEEGVRRIAEFREEWKQMVSVYRFIMKEE